MKKVRVIDLMKINCLSNCKLVAGESGLHNEVTWFNICFFNDIVNWVRGGEIVFLPGVGMDLTPRNLIQFMELSKASNVSALVVIIGYSFTKVPEEMKEYADLYGIPLYEMPNTYPLVDITKNIAMLLLNKENESFFVGEILRNAIFSYDNDGERYERDFIIRKVILKPHRRIMVIKLKTTIIEDVLDRLELYTHETLTDSSFTSVFYYHNTSTIVALLSNEEDIEPVFNSKIEELLQVLEERLKQLNLEIAACGFSSVFQSLSNCKKAFYEACAAIEANEDGIARRFKQDLIKRDNDFNYFYYDNLLTIEKILYSGIKVPNVSCKDWTQLIGHDKSNSSELCKTLVHYLMNNASNNEAANSLHIHRNTLIYRKKQIEDLLGKDLDNMQVVSDLIVQLAMCKDAVREFI